MFNRLGNDCKEANVRNEFTSGNVETASAIDNELDIMIRERKYLAEGKQEKKSKFAGTDTKLHNAGENI